MVCLVARTGRHLQRYNRGRRLVVGCIPYRYKINGNNGGTDDELEVLLISSKKSEEMMFPKVIDLVNSIGQTYCDTVKGISGGWELDESVEEAACRESLEEAGVLGDVESQLGTWIFKSNSRELYHEGLMFPLQVTQQLDLWAEKSARLREWMTVGKAKEVCKQPWMNEALDILVNRLKFKENKDVQPM